MRKFTETQRTTGFNSHKYVYFYVYIYFDVLYIDKNEIYINYKILNNFTILLFNYLTINYFYIFR